jgi:Undecaprenyl-phosphate glucose phosphotransferase
MISMLWRHICSALNTLQIFADLDRGEWVSNNHGHANCESVHLSREHHELRFMSTHKPARLLCNNTNCITMITSRQNLPFLYIGGDLFTLILTAFFSIYFFNESHLQEIHWVSFAVLILLWYAIGFWRKLYINLSNRFDLQISNYLKAYFILIGLLLIVYAFFPFPVPGKKVIIAFTIGFPILGLSTNLLLNNIMQFRPSPEESTRYTLVAGIGILAGNVEKQLSAYRKTGHKLRGFVNVKKREVCTVGQDKVVADVTNIHEYLTDNPVDEIVIALPVKTSKKLQSILNAADYHGVRVKYVADYQGLFGKNYKMQRFGQLEAINVRQLPLDEKYALLMKNSFDKVFSAFALLLLSPLFLVLAILIKLDSPGPVFYCPMRVGRGGKAFKVYKFRSMRENDTASGGTLSTQQDDPRITKIGKIMRKYSLDELPQFFNVLVGNMSVVGPRPHRSFLNKEFQASVEKYMIRHYFKPGITGWAQVNGWRGPTDTKEQKDQRTRHDLWYIENWTFWLDIKIVYLTIFSKKVHKSAF